MTLTSPSAPPLTKSEIYCVTGRNPGPHGFHHKEALLPGHVKECFGFICIHDKGLLAEDVIAVVQCELNEVELPRRRGHFGCCVSLIAPFLTNIHRIYVLFVCMVSVALGWQRISRRTGSSTTS